MFCNSLYEYHQKLRMPIQMTPYKSNTGYPCTDYRHWNAKGLWLQIGKPWNVQVKHEMLELTLQDLGGETLQVLGRLTEVWIPKTFSLPLDIIYGEHCLISVDSNSPSCKSENALYTKLEFLKKKKYQKDSIGNKSYHFILLKAMTTTSPLKGVHTEEGQQFSNLGFSTLLKKCSFLLIVLLIKLNAYTC